MDSDGQPESDDYDADELTDEEWALFVAHGQVNELNDAREDIYSLDDGEPSV